MSQCFWLYRLLWDQLHLGDLLAAFQQVALVAAGDFAQSLAGTLALHDSASGRGLFLQSALNAALEASSSPCCNPLLHVACSICLCDRTCSHRCVCQLNAIKLKPMQQFLSNCLGRASGPDGERGADHLSLGVAGLKCSLECMRVLVRAFNPALRSRRQGSIWRFWAAASCSCRASAWTELAAAALPHDQCAVYRHL